LPGNPDFDRALAIGTILLGSVWGDAKITAACAERIHHLFWDLPGPAHVTIRPEHETILKKAISKLEWIGEHATEYMRSMVVMRGLNASILNLYQVAVAYSKYELGMALLSAIDKTLEACTLETEFVGNWDEGIQRILRLLKSLQEATPDNWGEAQDKIKVLLNSDVAQPYLQNGADSPEPAMSGRG
jgi:hypothetical protein